MDSAVTAIRACLAQGCNERLQEVDLRSGGVCTVLTYLSLVRNLSRCLRLHDVIYCHSHKLGESSSALRPKRVQSSRALSSLVTLPE